MRVQETDWAEFGRRVRRLRNQRGLTQGEVAEPVASGSLISLIESGTRRPSARLLDHLAERLDVHPDELLTGRSPTAELELDLRLQEARENLRIGNDSGAAEIARQVATAAADLAASRLEARSLELLAALEERKSLYEPALKLYERAEALWVGEPAHLKFVTVSGLARCHQALGDPRLSIHLLESYLLSLESGGVADPDATMRTLSSLVLSYSAMGLIEKAADAAEGAQALAPHVTDAEQIACMNMNVARSLYEQGRSADALESIRRAERAYLSLGWEIDAARAKLNRGIVQMDKGDPEAARVNLAEAVETLRAADQTRETARALNELGRAERLAGDPSKARAYLEQAQGYLANGDFSERALNLRELALCSKETGDPKEAESLLRRAIDLYLLGGASREVTLVYRLLGDLYLEAGRTPEAAEAFRAGIEAIEQGAGA